MFLPFVQLNVTVVPESTVPGVGETILEPGETEQALAIRSETKTILVTAENLRRESSEERTETGER